MEFNEFQPEMARLITAYGARYFPQERVKLIFEASKQLRVDEFSRVVNRIIESCTSTPSVDKVREVIRAMFKPVQQKVYNPTVHSTMFTPNQTKFLWTLLKAAGQCKIPTEEIELIVEELDEVVKSKSSARAETLFAEIAKAYNLEFNAVQIPASDRRGVLPYKD